MKSRSLALLSAMAMVASLLIAVPMGAAAQTSTSVSSVAGLQDAVANASNGAVIEVQAGTYQLTAPLVISANNVTVRGMDPKAAAIELRAANNSRVFLVNGSGATIENVLITGGKVNNNKGGGVRVEASATLDLVDVEIADNFADEGGGLYNAGTTSITGSLLLGNDARRKGGGIENDGDLTIVNTTIADNEGKGGGGLSTAGTANLSFVTIHFNRSTNKIGAGALRNGGTLAIKNSLIANNLGSDNDRHDCSGTPNLDNVIVTSDQGCNPEGIYTVIAPGQLFEPLPPLDNGGPTRTLALLATSPAIDYTTACLGIAVDQRGVGRIDGACDLGAYEVDRVPPEVAAVASPTPNAGGWNNSPVTVTITASEADATIEYSTNGGLTWTVYGAPLLVDEDGTTELVYRATDADGNTSDPPGALTINLDTVAPTVTPTTADGPLEGDILLTLTADDGAGSGVAGIEYSIESAGWTAYESEVLITETTTVDFRATDYADNTSIAGQITLTIEPLSFDISIAASTTEVEVGAVTVPVENITTAIQNAAGAGITTASTPLSSIPLSSIPLSSIPLSSIPLSSIPLSSIPLSSIPLSSIPLSSIPLSSILVSQLGTSFDGGLDDLLLGTELDEVPLQAITFNDLVSVPLSSIPLSSIPLSSIPLSSIPLSSIDAFFNCSGTFDCDGATLGQAFDAGAIGSGLELGDVLSFGSVSFESTPLSSIPLSSIALGTTPLSSIPLSSILVPPASDTQRLAEWCSALGFATGSDGCNLVNTAGTSLMTLGLGGIPLSSIPLSSIPLSSIPLSSIPLSSIPLSSIFWASTPLSSIPLSSIPNVENLVDCGTADCAAGTLGSAVGAFLIGATVGDLDGLGSLDGFSLADLLFGLLAPTEIPWEEIDLNAARLPDAADPKQPTFTYDIELVVGGGRSASINVDLVPPEGFYFARDLGITGPVYSTDPSYPTTLDGIQVADPAEDLSTGTLSLTLSGVAPGTHTLSIALRAGIVLGEHTASVTADATTTREDPIDAGPATASIEVVEAGEAGGGSIPTLVDGELNLSHISRSDDIDLYEFTVDENLAGASAKILLSNLPADYDLVLYGPPVSAPLRGAPQPGFGLVEDFVFDLSPDDEVLDTDTLQDVPTNPSAVNLTNEVLNSVSAKRGTSQEEIDTGTLRAGRYVVQVSSYNGAFNPSPFGLRIRLSATAERTCDAPAFGLGTQGSLPTGVPENLNTLFLYNHARLVAAYPGSYQQVLDQLSLVATSDWTDLGVIGLVVPVDGNAAVWTALNQLKDDRCNPEASNNVVRAIGDLIDTYPNVENIVIIGDDAQIPMARIPDGTSVSNEREHGLTFSGNNELVGSLLGGYYLSDVPYGTSAGIAVNDHEFFVPERAVGRLVEHPSDIARALHNFVIYEGMLDDSTAAAASGYDFLSDGTALIKSELLSEGFDFGANAFLNNETWDRQDLINLLSGEPVVASINAHFDQSRALPALGNSTTNESDLFTVADLPSPFDGSVLFSMGCHAGLSLSDIQLGAASPDWAESLGGIWAANTGYGYGDTQLVALSEQLTANFAARLGSFPVGKAWQLALQEYAGGLFTLTPYDEKVVQEFTLYGLPMYRTGPAATSAPAPLPPFGAGPATFTDPFTSLQTASVSFSLPLGVSGGLELVTTPDGNYYQVEGETLEVRSRPVQPLTSVDITRSNGSGGLERTAGGALITRLIGEQQTGFNPLVFTPVVDLGDATANELTKAFRPEAGDATFPSGIQRVTTYEDEAGQLRQRLLVVPGRFVAVGPNGTKTQELFTELDAVVYYRDPNLSDFTAPLIRESVGRFGDGVVHFEIDVEGDGPIGGDDVQRVYALYRPDGAVGSVVWQGVDLTRVPGTDTWLGGRPIDPFTGTDFEFLVQAVDSNGNVSTSDAKGINFLTTQPVESAFINIVVGGDYSAQTGWYRTASATATTVAPNASIVGFRLDFGPETTWDGGNSVPISGAGGHLLQVFDSAGNQGLVFVAVDANGPLSFGSFAPEPTNGWNRGDVIVTLDAVDPFGSGVASILYTTDGSEPSAGSSAYTGPFSVSAEGINMVRYLAIDAIGNQGEEGPPLTIQVDLTAPDVTAVVPSSTSGWYNGPISVTLDATDPGSGVESIEYRFDEGDEWILYAGPFEVGAEGFTTIYFRATDAVGNTGDGQFEVGTLNVQIDATGPTVTITVPSEGATYAIGEAVDASYVCTDDGSGVDTCVGTVPTGTPIDTSAVGTFDFQVTATDLAGNVTTTTFTYAVAYSVCLQYDPDKAQPATGAVPIKLQLCDAAGNNLSKSNIEVTADSIRVGSNGDILFPGPNDTGNANAGFLFRFQAKGYIYNLNTTEVTNADGDLVPLGPGSFTLLFWASTTGPDVLYEARFTLR